MVEDDIVPWMRSLAGVLLAGLLLIVALRMTGSEQIRESLNQRGAHLGQPQIVVNPGPGTIVGGSVCTLLIAGGALILAGAAGRLSVQRMGEWAVGALVVGCGIVRVPRAQNRFDAAVGLADFGMGVAGGLAAA